MAPAVTAPYRLRVLLRSSAARPPLTAGGWQTCDRLLATPLAREAPTPRQDYDADAPARSFPPWDSPGITRTSEEIRTLTGNLNKLPVWLVHRQLRRAAMDLKTGAMAVPDCPNM